MRKLGWAAGLVTGLSVFALFSTFILFFGRLEPCTALARSGGVSVVGFKDGDPGSVAAVLYAAGARREVLYTFIQIAFAESGGKSGIVGPVNPDGSIGNRDGSRDLGLLQINTSHRDLLGEYDWRDPVQNARMGLELYKRRNGFDDWGTFKSGRYKSFAKQAQDGIVDLSRRLETDASVYVDDASAAPRFKNKYPNGAVPESELREIPWSPGERIAAGTLRDLTRLNTAFRAEFGVNLGITDGYRDLAGQIAAKARSGDGAATPGSSKHGLNLAVDVNVNGSPPAFGSRYYVWLSQNLGDYGFYIPDWAKANGSMPESWHIEYSGNPYSGGGSEYDDYYRMQGECKTGYGFPAVPRDIGSKVPSLCPATRFAADNSQLTPAGRNGFRCVAAAFPELEAIGGWRKCDKYREHCSGDAVDFMIPGWSGSGQATGDSVALFLIKYADVLNVKLIIWQQASWKPGRGWKPMALRPGGATQNHLDHVHANFGATDGG